MKDSILVIGIAGGTGSGKTTLMDNLIGQFPDQVTILSHDNYYRRHDNLTYEQRCKLNYDEPDIWRLCAGDRPSSARCMTLPFTTVRTKPSTSCRKRSSLWKGF